MSTLIVITGPTGVGKTAAAIEVAQRLGCEIINADSRQVFKGIPIGTAAPTPEEQALVRHHFVQFKELDEYYSAAQFEADVMALLPQLWQHGDYVVMCGGSMMYVDAVCNGIDFIPDISDEVRHAVKQLWHEQGLEPLLDELERLDPVYFAQVDKQNHRRVLHAVEVCRQAGVPYSTLRTGETKQRPFNIIKVGLNMERSLLFDRINRRVDAMIEQGLEQEARSVYHLRHLNSLNTVGYKEMFAIFDGTMERTTAIERIKKNTRLYAKKQLRWLQRDTSITWCHPEECLKTTENLLKMV
ncbi:MAG: tRNA (adenosine(37)-N6)-dimethylallyltransferase MiaA [Muribaculaceae bacterium]|nr:tRNA (adenosine(37)-N6)-dimethylallyltransferase MiaA [Muribaculaceae bacterium]